jgi:hypothetical protein
LRGRQNEPRSKESSSHRQGWAGHNKDPGRPRGSPDQVQRFAESVTDLRLMRDAGDFRALGIELPSRD